MIRDDANLAPSGVQQSADTVEERIDLVIDLANKESIERMPQSVELTALGPTPAVAADGHFRLIAVENFDSSTRHRIPQSRGICGLVV